MSTAASLQSALDQVEADALAQRAAALRVDRARLRAQLTSIIQNKNISLAHRDSEIENLRTQIASVRKAVKAAESLDTGIIASLPMLGDVDAKATTLRLFASALKFLERKVAREIDTRDADAKEKAKRERELESLPSE